MRSFRAQHLSRFVKALLDGEAEIGRELFAEFRDHYPIVLTRSMREARRWIRRQRRGTERAGLVAASRLHDCPNSLFRAISARMRFFCGSHR